MPRSPLLPIFLIVAVDVLGLTIILPLLPFYAEHYGASPLVVGLLTASFAACQLVSGPIIGRISDRVGRRPLLLVSQVGTLAGFLILAFADSLWMVFLGRMLDGLTAGNLSIAQAYISDHTKPEERARSFGLIGIAFGFGFLIGPLITSVLSRYGYQVPVFAAAGLSATSIAATYFLLPRGAPPQREAGTDARRLGILSWSSYAEYFRRPRLGGLLVEFFLFAFSFSTFVAGFALFAERRYTWNGVPFGPMHVGLVFGYVGVLGIILQGGLIGRLVKRFGEARLITAGFLTVAVGYAVLGFSYAIAPLLVAATVSSFGNGVLRPALTSLITRNSGRDEQGVVLGLTQSLMSVSGITAPILAGFLIDHRQLIPWALVGAGTAAIGVMAASAWRRGDAAMATEARPG